MTAAAAKGTTDIDRTVFWSVLHVWLERVSVRSVSAESLGTMADMVRAESLGTMADMVWAAHRERWVEEPRMTQLRSVLHMFSVTHARVRLLVPVPGASTCGGLCCRHLTI